MKTSSPRMETDPAPSLKLTTSDVSEILRPFKGKTPAGESLRYDPVWDEIRQARFEEEDLPQGDWTHKRKQADWESAIKLCIDVLKTRSKDLQVCLWLSEALYKKQGLAGFRDGLRLTRELMVAFRDAFHPYSDEDPEYRVAPLIWFNQELTKHLRFQELNIPADVSEKTYVLYEYDALAKQGGEASTTPADQLTPRQHFDASISLTPKNFYRDNLGCLAEIKQELVSIHTFMEKNFPEFPSVLRGVFTKIEHIEDLFTAFGKEATVTDQGIDQEVDEPQDLDTSQSSPQETTDPKLTTKSSDKESSGKLSSGKESSDKMTKESIKGAQAQPRFQSVSSRDEAYQRLAEIATYLKKVEPHSPTPYLINRAVQWGNMSLADVMTDLTKSGTNIEQALQLLGISEKTPS